MIIIIRNSFNKKSKNHNSTHNPVTSVSNHYLIELFNINFIRLPMNEFFNIQIEGGWILKNSFKIIITNE